MTSPVEFLKRLYPSGPWVLCVKMEDRKFLTYTFRPDTLAQMEKFIAEHNGKRNLYFSVNPPRGELTKKAERQDIEAVHLLHVDLDPRRGEDLDEERKAILELLTTRLPKGVLRPSIVIDSGGGYWGLWRLEEPLRLDGTLERAEEAKLYSLQYERLFGDRADGTHNIDRVARLPGTWNIPDEKKKAKGRRRALAEVVYFEDTTYKLSQFTPAVVVQASLPGSAVASDQSLELGGDLRRIEDFSELAEYSVPTRLAVIAANGREPDKPKEKDDSRSAWLFDFVCGMLRSKVPEEIVYSIITDPGWQISESILDKGSAADRYAKRQIRQARDYLVNPKMMEMNGRFAVIGQHGGKCRVIEEVEDLVLNRTRLVRMSFDDFRNRFMHIKVREQGPKGDILVPLGRWWLEHPDRRQYESMAFAPNRQVSHIYNLWRGFACEARPGSCDLYLAHLRDNICDGNDEYFEYLLSWMARGVQQPDSPGEVAVVMRGEQGTGKGVAAKTYGSLFGRHYMPITDPKHLVGSFNAHLRDCVFIFADEAFYAGDKKHENILKMIITEDTIVIEGKGVDAESGPNCTRLMMASNSDWVIPVGRHERRFFVLDVGNKSRQKSAYFRAIKEEMDSGGREALLHMLMTRDLSQFDVRVVPKTRALREQRDMSLSPEESWWYEKLKHGCLIGEHPWQTEVLKGDLVEDYVDHARRFNILRRSNDTTLGMFLNRFCPGLRTRQKMTKIRQDNGVQVTRRAYFYELPNLENARRFWEERYGSQEWPDLGALEEPPSPVRESREF